MKYLLSTSLLALCFFGLSCKKCANCETTITTTTIEPGKPQSTEVITRNEGEYCGDDLKKKKGYKNTTESYNGNTKFITTVEIKCD